MWSKLQLKEYFLEDVSIKLDQEYQPPKDPKAQVTADIDWDWSLAESKQEKNVFLVTLWVTVKSPGRGKTFPYNIRVELAGFVEYRPDEGETPEHVKTSVLLGGLTMLYGIIRGLIGSATAQFKWHKFTLPGINFVEGLGKKSKKAGQQAKKK